MLAVQLQHLRPRLLPILSGTSEVALNCPDVLYMAPADGSVCNPGAPLWLAMI
jgi:hypothetical protein